MALVMMGLRVAACAAVQAAQTLVGDNVLDSRISALDPGADGRLRSQEQRPFVAVYTDAARAEDLGRSGLRVNGQVELVFTYGVSLSMAEIDRETGESRIIEGVPGTDSDFEAVLDVLEAQLLRALGAPDSPWAQVLAGFVTDWGAKRVARSSSAGEGTRLAAGQTRLMLDVIADPLPGQDFGPETVWGRFLAQLAADHPDRLGLFERALGFGTGAEAPGTAALVGLSSRTATALKLWPLWAPKLSAVTADMGAAE